MAFSRVTNLVDGVLDSQLNQFIDAWTGVAGKAVAFAQTALNDAVNFAGSFKNLDAGSKALIAYKSDGSTLLRVDANGVIASGDGSTAAARVVTTGDTGTVTSAMTASEAAVTFTPTVTQGVSVTTSSAAGRYLKRGRKVSVSITIAISSAGTAGQQIVIGGLPIASLVAAGGAPGWGFYTRTGVQTYAGLASWASTTSFTILQGGAPGGSLGQSPSFATANTDVVYIELEYESAT